ncbi:MAG: prepilin peptidase [Candidatus Pacebacteria bacterium]|nr:prepilin peptidase [Candidatus Paceibacterota bacterium]
MQFIFYVFAFIIGLLIGSFLNCVIYRLEKEESFLKGRSYCPFCKHQLSWQDLFPVFSFLILRGKCRYCKKPISWQYPLVELATGFLFLLVAQHSFLNLLVTSYWLLVTSLLIIIFVFDLKHFIIPDKVIYAAILASGIWYLIAGIFLHLYSGQELLIFLYSAFFAALFFFIIVLISRGNWMGIGDIKLAFFMGLFLGFPKITVALFLAFLIGAIIGVGLIISRKRKFSSEIPFGPFLVTGTFLALFFGQNIISWYINLF